MPETLLFRPKMAGASRGRWQRVIDARRQSREALGRTTDEPRLFDAPPKPRPKAAGYVPPFAAEPPQLSESIGVLTLGEAAARLGVSRRELEAMIKAGKIEALPTGYTRTVPTREIERLERLRLGTHDRNDSGSKSE